LRKMKATLTLLKWSGITLLVTGLMFSSGVFTALLYGKITGKLSIYTGGVATPHEVHASEVAAVDDEQRQTQRTEQALPEVAELSVAVENLILAPPVSVLLSAPIIRQNPELPRGCEITSLAMLLQFYGIDVTKMDLLPQMKMDPTPIEWNGDGSIRYWGDPNNGFVGDITLKAKGFGIYHKALFPLLQSYIPTAEDLTGEPFERIEERLAKGIPVMVWTTTKYQKPEHWVEWDSANGRIRVTFSEHAVLMVGYDEQHVYLNDPLSGKQSVKVNKKQFLASWDALGNQALSYWEPK
jgi:uncharacterized protein YvpB